MTVITKSTQNLYRILFFHTKVHGQIYTKIVVHFTVSSLKHRLRIFATSSSGNGKFLFILVFPLETHIISQQRTSCQRDENVITLALCCHWMEALSDAEVLYLLFPSIAF